MLLITKYRLLLLTFTILTLTSCVTQREPLPREEPMNFREPNALHDAIYNH